MQPVRNGFITLHTGQTTTEGVQPPEPWGQASSKSLTWDGCDLSGEHMRCSQHRGGGHGPHSCTFKPGLLTHKTHHTVSVQKPISANLRHSRIIHLVQTLWHHPFLPAFHFPSLSSLTFWSLPPISHLNLTTEPSLNCFWVPPILWLLPLQGPPTCSGQDCGGSSSKY